MPSYADKKSCNCVKSRCLKLYCDCFAQGVYCSGCSCQDCHNTEENAGLVASKRAGIREKIRRCDSWDLLLVVDIIKIYLI